MFSACVCVCSISPYFVSRYNFSSDTKLSVWSGDNPCSVAGLGLNAPGDIGISLGTSDTVCLWCVFVFMCVHVFLFRVMQLFAIVREPQPGVEGHVFVNPVDEGTFVLASTLAQSCS
jgi:xylulokinase